MGYKEDVLIMNFLEKHGIRPYTRIKDIPSYSYFKELLAEFLKENDKQTKISKRLQILKRSSLL